MYTFYMFVWSLYVTTAYSACLNTVSKTSPLNVTIPAVDERGFIPVPKVVELTSCKQLSKQYPSQCARPNIGGENGLCCSECAKIDRTCMDQVTRYNPILVHLGFYHGILQVKSCPKLARKYSVLCKVHGGNGKLCCQSCKSVPESVLECIDDFRTPPGIFPEFGDVFKNCKWYTKKVPCMCADPDIQKSCCASCKNIDTDALGCDCWDRYNKKTRRGWSKFVSVLYGPDKDHMVTLVNNERIEHCSEIANWYPFSCGGNDCCASCKGVDNECVDNLNWKTTVTINRGSKECVDCNCHDIRRKSKMLMRHACKNDVKGTNMAMGAREACCHQCKRLGFDKPDGYEIDKNLHYTISAIM